MGLATWTKQMVKIVIARAGAPCARLIPERPHERQIGAMADRWSRLDVEFFAPLDDNDLAEWDG